MRALLLLCTAAAITLAPRSTLASNGRLDSMRAETQSSGSSSSGSTSGTSLSVDDPDDPRSGQAVDSTPIRAYIKTVWRLYARYPYADGAKGYVYVIDRDEKDRDARGHPNQGEGSTGQRFAGNVSVHGAYFGRGLGRAGLGLELMVRRFGFALDVLPHLELTPPDALTLGSTALLFSPILRRRVQVFAGLGAVAMLDGMRRPPDQRTNAVGANVTFRATVLPIRPLVLRGRFDSGRLGQAPTRLARATIGAIVSRVEFFGGYEVRDVGRVRTHGPTGGLRVWF